METVIGENSICHIKGSRWNCLFMVSEVFLQLSMFWCGQVTETEREDLEESEKVQYWVERLCQTRLEQISSVENDSPEVKAQPRWRFAEHVLG